MKTCVFEFDPATGVHCARILDEEHREIESVAALSAFDAINRARPLMAKHGVIDTALRVRARDGSLQPIVLFT